MQDQPSCRGDLRDLPLLELRAVAQAQELNYLQGEVTDDAAGLELFRRAIVDGDEGAWEVVTDVYRRMLVAQAGRRVVRGLVVEDDGFCVDRAFQRFWRASRNGHVHQFTDLASILKYLNMCLGSVLLDEARARRRQACVSIDDVSPETCVSADPSSHVISQMTGREVWDIIDRELVDPGERLLARLSFVGGLTPREIQARHADKFQDVFAVYRAKRNMIERLRRSRALRQLLD